MPASLIRPSDVGRRVPILLLWLSGTIGACAQGQTRPYGESSPNPRYDASLSEDVAGDASPDGSASDVTPDTTAVDGQTDDATGDHAANDGSEEDASQDAPAEACTPMNGAEACGGGGQARCGAWDDGCGGSVDCGACAAGRYCNASGLCDAAACVWDIWQTSSCYEQDAGHMVHHPWMDRWLLYYGAVTDLLGLHSCSDPGYSEDIWATWSATDGLTFGQSLGGVTPPIRSLDASQLQAVLGKGSGACPSCTGWHIGDPTVARGGTSDTWYMFFDTQSCADLTTGAWSDMIAAVSDNAFQDWQIVGPVSNLPGSPPFSLPRLFSDPASGHLYLLYNDTTVTIRAAELVDDGTGTTLLPLSGGAPVVPPGSADLVSPFYWNGDYWAGADNFGTGQVDDLHTLWLLGPSSTPTAFDWSARSATLTAGEWYGTKLWAPSVLGPDDTGDATVRAYFWGSSGTDACTHNGSDQVGALVY